ncbi:M14 family metallocarboxypeptidase [Fictibacillus iocasae]|uniref:M14 family metallocarboxypeptidase n=1 Tax=Fictibacillus iocasae TaxID=2715437 RepID=A0ABW2NIA1_9BACL
MKVKVRNGDTITYYSRLFSLPPSLILSEDGKETMIQGDTIIIPGYKISPYQVKQGDTLIGLSEALSVPVDMLHLLNQEKLSENGAYWNIPQRMEDALYSGKKEYTSETLQKDAESLTNAYPFIRKEVIGHSVLEKPIIMLIIGNGPKKVHINASFHANEWITTGVLMEFLQRLAQSAVSNGNLAEIKARKLIEDITIFAVPMVDPDGVDLVLKGPPAHPEFGPLAMSLNKNSSDFTGWKANIRGVDLNNQFPALWEIEKERKPQQPSPRDYPGDEPLSEPEAKAMALIAETYRFDAVIALHTQGQEIYWGFEGREPTVSEEVVKKMEQRTGYRALQYLDSYAGYKDWFIYHFQKPGFTIELGLGVNPIDLEQFEEIYQQAVQIFLAAME